MELREEIGLRFKQARLDKHMTQQEVAEKLGMVQTSYIRYESRPLTYDTKKAKSNWITVKSYFSANFLISLPTNYTDLPIIFNQLRRADYMK